jgi:hypothetical protein
MGTLYTFGPVLVFLILCACYRPLTFSKHTNKVIIIIIINFKRTFLPLFKRPFPSLALNLNKLITAHSCELATNITWL